MIVVNNKLFDCVEIHGVRYPVDKTLVTSQVFFRVVDMYGSQQFYLNPEEYYDAFHRRPYNDEDKAKYSGWATGRQTFLQKHSAWYNRIDSIKNDVAGWLSESKIEKGGYYIGKQPYVV